LLNPDPPFQVNPDPIRIQGFDDQKLKEKYNWNFYTFFNKKCKRGVFRIGWLRFFEDFHHRNLYCKLMQFGTYLS
jgi:hypothetical protein